MIVPAGPVGSEGNGFNGNRKRQQRYNVNGKGSLEITASLGTPQDFSGVGGTPSSDVECPDCRVTGAIGDFAHSGGGAVIGAEESGSYQSPPGNADCPKYN